MVFITLLQFEHNEFMVLQDSQVYQVICGISFCSFVFTCILQYLGNYHNMFKVSKLLCFFGKPVVHKSMIYDFLQNPKSFTEDKENSQFPEFFEIFLENKDQVSLYIK